MSTAHDGVWPAASVAELASRRILLVEDGNHGEYRPRPDEFSPLGVAFIRAADMANGRVLFNTASRINEVARRRIIKGIGAPGDVLLSHKGTVGKVAMVERDAPPFVCSPQTTVWRSLDESQLDARYLYAFLRSEPFRRQLAAYKGETDMADYVSLTNQRTLRVVMPPVREQRAIARILGDLDDKIELNRRMNETLEAMARALFQSWFVDFDPVRAKMRGEQPVGMDAATAALFPSRLVQTEQGELPEAWRFETVREVSEALFDGPHATPPDADAGPVFLGIRNFTGTSLDLTEVRHISEADWPQWTKRTVPRHEDVVFTYEATLGFFALIPPGLRACLGRRTALVRPRRHVGDAHYLFHWFTAPPFQEFLRSHRQSGATVDRILLKDFPGYPVLSPGADIVARFETVARPIWQSIHARQAENATLVALRDSLLPQLLSGELRIADIVEGAA